jgi:hypothetical protein
MQDMHQNNRQQDAKRWVSETRQKASQASRQQDNVGAYTECCPNKPTPQHAVYKLAANSPLNTEAAWKRIQKDSDG